jgi:hypothetical protein
MIKTQNLVAIDTKANISTNNSRKKSDYKEVILEKYKNFDLINSSINEIELIADRYLIII